MVLKVFDQRFATQLREDEKVQPYKMDIEFDYHRFVRDGGAEAFIDGLNTHDEMAEEDESWNTPQEEAYLHDCLLDLYKTGIQVYNTLKDLQGEEVPGLLAAVLVSGFDPDVLEPVTQGFPGILLQHIQGFLLTNLADYSPREIRQSICDDSVRILNLMDDRGILNKDVQTRSFIVSLDNAQRKHFKVIMIDFALCNSRADYEDDQEWSEFKAIQEEQEEAIGRVMQTRLEGSFVYRESCRYKKPASYYE
ncbi:hypothetical protein N7478_005364 [Penicillium angulare]|uniref:uncharacterized protein n=1 Tax=Penicillium angulare TaxID=116970 RepID=UPI00254187FA|nr:uncharacterized protein N7478_005364 [Penicillium angulare]KAJ5279992.1 hypothetical protein N7478_005364 [Penicillium angulare]